MRTVLGKGGTGEAASGELSGPEKGAPAKRGLAESQDLTQQNIHTGALVKPATANRGHQTGCLVIFWPKNGG